MFCRRDVYARVGRATDGIAHRDIRFFEDAALRRRPLVSWKAHTN